jgi:two-component system cell cycle response regulator
VTHISTRRSRGRNAARALWTLGFLVFAAHAVYNVLGVGRGTFDAIVSPWTPFGVFVACAAASVARGLSQRRERAAWWALGAGLLLYALGQAYWVLVLADEPSASFPTAADLLWLSLSPCAVAAIVLLARAQGTRTRGELWLDGAIAGLAIASLAVLVIFELVIDPLAALHAAPANLAFALADALVVGFGVAACAVLGWRPPRSLLVLIIGFAAQALQDTAYLSALVHGTLTSGGLLDSCWLLGLLLISAAAVWPRPARAAARQPRRGALVAFPFVFALAAVALVGYEALAERISPVPIALTVLTLVAVVVRFAHTFRSHLTMLASSEREAVTDALTGLRNRRALLRDAERALATATPAHPVTLAIFDLDGFKTYNDTYGHPAGDALLVRLGHKLAHAVAPAGRAYRLGGDEFCALLWGDRLERRQALAAATAALTEEGEAFTVRNSYGSVVAPDETAGVTEALRRADQRLYAAKDSRGSGRAHEACQLLRQVLIESEPELDGHHAIVGRLAHAVARRLRLDGSELRTVVRAAELHDIGKIAIPDAILHKPAPLNDEERAFMRRHTTIGERFLASIPTLEPLARLVRSSHERFDGAGYPDGLAGKEIPLGARIILACDAYDAMTADRPYRAGMPREQAIAELRRNTGSQFDPAVIDALCAELAELEVQTPAALTHGP